MVEDVKEFVDYYIGLEPNIITFHIEAMASKEETLETIKYIKQNGIKVRNCNQTKHQNRRYI